MMFHYFHGLHRGPGVFAWLFLALLIAALAVGAVAVVRSLRRPPSPMKGGSRPAPGPQVDPALAELRIRYARGDITWEEYVQRATNLGHPIAPGDGRPAAPTEPLAPPPGS